MAALISRRILGNRQQEQVVLVFEWHGGTYIDVREEGQATREVINVWDYEKDASTYPFTRSGLTTAISNWIKEYGPATLRRDVVNHWRF